jgi:hypothetical protein
MVDAPFERDGFARDGFAIETRAKAKNLTYWCWLAVTLGVMAAVAAFVFLR